MLLDKVKAGDRLEIALKRDKNHGKTYVSRMEERREGNYITIHMPLSYGKPVKIPVNADYSISFFTETGKLEFDAKIVRYIKEDGFDLAVVKITSAGERVQLREFFRHNCVLPFRFSVVSGEDEIEKNNKTMFDGIIKDLGGGGIRFISNEEMEEKSLIQCLISLGDDLVAVIGKVLLRQQPSKSDYKYEYRIQFTDIMPKDREIIIQFIFNEQRRGLRRMRP